MSIWDPFNQNIKGPWGPTLLSFPPAIEDDPYLMNLYEMTQEQDKKLFDSLLYVEETGDLFTSDERADNLDKIREHLIEISTGMDKLTGVDLKEKIVFSALLLQTMRVYAKVKKMHEELLADGK
jgi:hypothetical protein